VLNTVVTAAEAERNDDTALRDELLAAEMRREMGEISDEEFGDIEADVLARIREIKERREGSGPIAFGGEPIETSPDTQFAVEATVSGDFHEPTREPVAFEAEPVTAGEQSGTVIEGTLIDPVDGRGRRRRGTPVRASQRKGTSGTVRSAGSTRLQRPSRVGASPRKRTRRPSRPKNR
jgi:hypothetical protein